MIQLPLVLLATVFAFAEAKPMLTLREGADAIGQARPGLVLSSNVDVDAPLAAPIECYKRTGNLNAHDSAILCSGASSASAPIDCYNKTGNLNAHDSAILCSGTTSPTQPIECYKQTGNLNAHDSAILCSQHGARLEENSSTN